METSDSKSLTEEVYKTQQLMCRRQPSFINFLIIFCQFFEFHRCNSLTVTVIIFLVVSINYQVQIKSILN